MPVENLDETSVPICDMADKCHQQLQNRLETIESAVRAIVSILSIQKSELFTTVNKMLEQDQAVREILSRSEFIQNSGDFSTVGSAGLNAAVEATKGNTYHEFIIHHEILRCFIVYFYADFSQHGKSVENLKGAIKCSLANLIDISTKGIIGKDKSIIRFTIFHT